MQSICVFFAAVSFPELTFGNVSRLWQDVAPTTPFFNNVGSYENMRPVLFLNHMGPLFILQTLCLGLRL